MSLCRNIAAVVGFFLALTLPLSFALGTVEYPPAIGPQSVVVLMVEFSDEKPECYPPVDQIEAVIFGMVNDYYVELSYDQMFFEGYVTKKFYQIGPKDSYKRNEDVVAAAILAADEEVDYSAYRHVIVSLITPRKFHWWGLAIYTYPWHDLQVETDDGVTVEEAILLQGISVCLGTEKWVNVRPLQCWVHELAHGLGLPDDSAYIGHAGVPFEALPDTIASGNIVHMLAWSKIALGWIPTDKVMEVSLGTTTRVVLDPIEQDTTRTLVVKIVKTPESYWLVEARRPIGYDAYYPTLLAPSPADAIGHPPIEGVLITRIVHPASAVPPAWGWEWDEDGNVEEEGVKIYWTSELLDIGLDKNTIFVDEEEDLVIAVVGEEGLSYVVEITTADRETEIRKLLEQGPRFVVADLDISPTEVGARQPVTISVNLTNVGKQEGSCSVNLETQYGARWYRYGYYVDTQRVTLMEGESKIVAFTVVPEDLGLWLVRVAGLEGEFMVHWTPPG